MIAVDEYDNLTDPFQCVVFYKGKLTQGALENYMGKSDLMNIEAPHRLFLINTSVYRDMSTVQFFDTIKAEQAALPQPEIVDAEPVDDATAEPDVVVEHPMFRSLTDKLNRCLFLLHFPKMLENPETNYQYTKQIVAFQGDTLLFNDNVCEQTVIDGEMVMEMIDGYRLCYKTRFGFPDEFNQYYHLSAIGKPQLLQNPYFAAKELNYSTDGIELVEDIQEELQDILEQWRYSGYHKESLEVAKQRQTNLDCYLSLWLPSIAGFIMSRNLHTEVADLSNTDTFYLYQNYRMKLYHKLEDFVSE